MNISEHTQRFIQEMKRRNYSKNTIENYTSCISFFFSQSKKDHPKNINEQDIKEFLGTLKQTKYRKECRSGNKTVSNKSWIK